MEAFVPQLPYFYNNRFESEFSTGGTISQEAVHHTLINENALTHGMHSHETAMAIICNVLMTKNWSILNKIPIMHVKDSDKNMLRQSLEGALQFWDESASFQQFESMSTVGLKRKDGKYWREKGFGIATGRWKFHKTNLLTESIEILKKDIKKAAPHGSWANALAFWVGMPREAIEYKISQNYNDDITLLDKLWADKFCFVVFFFFFFFLLAQ